MLFTSLLVAASAFSGLVAAQSNSSENLPPGVQPCCTVDSNLVPQDMKQEWCLAQRNTCPEICGGVNQLARGGQDCDQDTLEYTCECRNGTVPQMEQYQQSVPGLMCRFWFDQCINATNQNLEFQVECQNQRDANCGNLTTTDAETTSSAEPSSTPTQTSGGSQNSASPTGTGEPTASATPGAAVAVAREFGTPLLIGGIAAIFGLAL